MHNTLIMKAEDLKKIRQNLNLTQEELAKLIGVSKNTIYNYENGHKIPASKILIFEQLKSQYLDKTTQEKPVYETGFDEKIAEHEEKIREIQKEISRWEEKITQDPEKKATYEKYIASYEERIFLLNEIINLTLEAKKDFLENNDD